MLTQGEMKKKKHSIYVMFKSKIKAKMEDDKVGCPFTVTIKIAADPGCILIGLLGLDVVN